MSLHREPIQHPAEVVSENPVEAAVRETLYDSEPLRQSKATIEVAAADGVVTLTGNVRTRTHIDFATTLARRAADFLARKELFARTVTLKLRYATFETITRSATRSPATRDPGEIAGRALALLEKTDAGTRPVRLLGVSLHGLGPAAAEPPAPDQDAPQLGLPVDPAIGES